MKMTSLLLIRAFTLANGNLWADSGHQDSIERLRLSSDVLHSSMEAPDKGIPEEVVSRQGSRAEIHAELYEGDC